MLTHLKQSLGRRGERPGAAHRSCPRAGHPPPSRLWPGLAERFKTSNGEQMPGRLPFAANSYGGWGEGHRVVGDLKGRMPSLPLGSPKLPLKQEEQQKNAAAPRITGKGRERLLAVSLRGGSGTLPLNLKIQEGGLHPSTPTTKWFMGRVGVGEVRGERGGKRASLRKKEAKLG